jgi:hypothetical protein
MSTMPMYFCWNRRTGLEREVAPVHQVGRHVAERVDEQVDIHAACPVRQHVVRRVEIDRRDHRDQVADLLRVDRGEAQAERPPWQIPSRLILSTLWRFATTSTQRRM